MDMSKRDWLLAKARRSHLSPLLGVALLLIGGLLFLSGGLWSWHQNVTARSYLYELKEKAALIPVAEGESAALLSMTESETVLKEVPSATEETPTFFTRATQDRTSKEYLVPAPGGLQSLLAAGSARVSLGEDGLQITVRTSQETLRPAPSTNPEAHAPAIQAKLEQEVASVVSVVSPIPPSTSVPPVKVMLVGSGGEDFTFTPADLESLPPLGSLSPATRIRIPAIDLISPVAPLALLKQQGFGLFILPKEAVGQVPGTGNAGEGAQGWYLAHQSGIFEHLPEIVDLVVEGKTVDVILETEEEAYLYRVSGRPVILPASEFNSGYFHANLHAPYPEIVLATCVPPKKWDYRLLVKARLVGRGSDAGG